MQISFSHNNPYDSRSLCRVTFYSKDDRSNFIEVFNRSFQNRYIESIENQDSDIEAVILYSSRYKAYDVEEMVIACNNAIEDINKDTYE